MTSPAVVCEPKKGEPGLLFHEFIFLLSRIAIINVNTSGSISGKLNDFFIEKLGFSRVIDIQRARINFDDVNRRMNQSDEEGDGDLESGEEEDDEDWDSDEIELDEN